MGVGEGRSVGVWEWVGMAAHIRTYPHTPVFGPTRHARREARTRSRTRTIVCFGSRVTRDEDRLKAGLRTRRANPGGRTPNTCHRTPFLLRPHLLDDALDVLEADDAAVLGAGGVVQFSC